MIKNPTYVTHIVYEADDDTVGVALRKVGRSQFLEVQAGSTGAVSIEIPLIGLEEAIVDFREVCGEEPYGYGQGNPVYDRGYDDGYHSGHDDGYDGGYDDGYSSGRKDGYEVGTAAGAETGLIEGYDDGMKEGLKIGRIEGYDAGIKDGIVAGGVEKYNEGYAHGRQAERDGVGHD